MTSSIERRVALIAEELRAQLQEPCQQCWGHGAITLCVPDPDDEDRPEYTPTHCPECGIKLHRVMRIIGISDDDV